MINSWDNNYILCSLGLWSGNVVFVFKYDQVMEQTISCLSWMVVWKCTILLSLELFPPPTLLVTSDGLEGQALGMDDPVATRERLFLDPLIGLR
jgi:hypothetical protein